MITDDDIRRVMSHRAFEAGIEYQMDGRVHDLRAMSDGTTIKARVTGSGRATYEQTILLARGPKRRLLPSGSCSCPVGFNCKHVAAVLFEYQDQAALAPGMGLDKTVQALAHLAVEQAQGRTDLPSLVICPTSLVPNWLAEATRFAPGLRCLVLHGSDRAERFAAIAAHDLVITTYPLLVRDHAVLTAQDWHLVMLDEAKTIKNRLVVSRADRESRQHRAPDPARAAGRSLPAAPDQETSSG